LPHEARTGPSFARSSLRVSAAERPTAHTSREDAMPSKKKKKVADLSKKSVSSKKAETVKGGRKLNFSAKLQKSY
jgi:hypothetical protein